MPSYGVLGTSLRKADEVNERTQILREEATEGESRGQERRADMVGWMWYCGLVVLLRRFALWPQLRAGSGKNRGSCTSLPTCLPS